MKHNKMKIIKLHENAIIPEYKTKGSAGMDLHCLEPFRLRQGERKLISTGLTLDIPEGYEAQIRPRSGLANNHGVTVLNSPGTIDSDYKGEVKVLLINFGYDVYNALKGERIAQLVYSKFERVSGKEEEGSNRGTGGFGSTGLN